MSVQNIGIGQIFYLLALSTTFGTTLIINVSLQIYSVGPNVF
jgi:hypothetical protein